MSEKLCVFCKYFYLDMGSPSFSEWTPAESAEIYCTKKHWSMELYGYTKQYREYIIQAKDCPDYKQVND